MIDFARKHGAKWMMTLTLGRDTCTAEESSYYIKETWRKFRDYLKIYAGLSSFGRLKQLGTDATTGQPVFEETVGNLAWVWVLEFQKDGYAHLHVCWNQGLDESWISKMWAKLGGGTIIDNRTYEEGQAEAVHGTEMPNSAVPAKVTNQVVNLERVGFYLSKYLSKSLAGLGFKKGERRYSSIRGAGIMAKKTGFISLGNFHVPLEVIGATTQCDAAGESAEDGYLAWLEFDRGKGNEIFQKWKAFMFEQIPF